ncbi:MAG: FHA domain-containing protein [Promethearchaeota archaeon]
MIKCENCGTELKKEDLNLGICPNPECGIPISEENKKRLLQLIGKNDDDDIKDIKVIPEGNEDAALEVMSCKNCGFPMTKEEYYSGMPCPVCGKDPQSIEAPPEIPPNDGGLRDSGGSRGEVIVNQEQGSRGGSVVNVVNEPQSEKEIEVEIMVGEKVKTRFLLPINKELGRSFFSQQNFIKSDVINYVSSTHLKIEEHNGNFYIKDLGSLNGTYINYEKLEPNREYLLRLGDYIIIGDPRIVLRVNKIDYETLKASYILRDPITDVSHYLVEGKSEIIGRNSVSLGNNKYDMHIFLKNIYWNRYLRGDSSDLLNSLFRSISKSQFKIQVYSKDLDIVCNIENLSRFGTYVNNQYLDVNDSKEISESVVISFGNNFRVNLEKRP